MFEGICEGIEGGVLDAQVATVFSTSTLVSAACAKWNVPFFNKPDHVNDDVWNYCRANGIDLVVLAEYNRYLKIQDDYQGRVLNIHPALLPAHGGPGMYGLAVHQAVLDAGDKWSGFTIHVATPTYDKGEVLFQWSCPVYENDEAHVLRERVRFIERLYSPQVIQQYLERLNGG